MIKQIIIFKRTYTICVRVSWSMYQTTERPWSDWTRSRGTAYRNATSRSSKTYIQGRAFPAWSAEPSPWVLPCEL